MSSKEAMKQAVAAAVSVADDIAGGRLDPDDLERQLVAEARELFGRVEGPDDPLWELHVGVGRQLMAVGCGWITSTELAEWTAVYRQAEAQAPAGPSWIERALAEGSEDD